MAPGALAGFARTSFAHDGKERDVYRLGAGPAVVVIAEMPGITPKVVDFARRVVDLGCTVALPHLFGKPGADPFEKGLRTTVPAVATTMVPACVSREFSTWGTGRTSPVVRWLRALANTLHDECGGPGVGAVGMCFTGGFALGMIAEGAVIAPVLSQPSLPFALTRAHRRDPGLSDADLDAAVNACAARDIDVIGLRFTDDRLSPPERFAHLKKALGDHFVAVEIDSSKGNPWGHPRTAHSVLTEHLVDEPGQPTRDALDRVLALFREKLLN